MSSVIAVRASVISATLEAVKDSIPQEVLGWINDFANHLDDPGFGFTDLVHSLVQMGIDDPNGDCDCAEQYGKDFMDDEIWRWCHEHHREFNRIYWEMISRHPKLFSHLRRVLQADLKTTSVLDEEMAAIYKDNGHEGLSESYGKIVLHEYAQQLLDHFLWADASKADWI